MLSLGPIRCNSRGEMRVPCIAYRGTRMTPRKIYIIYLISSGVVLASLLHVSLTALANAGDTEAANGSIIVELFTSEGCSSCPPADALLQQIDNKATRNGRRVIAISEHVTYWNHLGWSDPFSDEVYTQRQDEYARRFHLDSVYTPQMVIDGDEQILGSDQKGLLRALEQNRENSPVTFRVSAVERQGDSLAVGYSLAGNFPANGADLVAVIADDEEHSNVARGENTGRVLTHVSVARMLKRFKANRAGADNILQIDLPHPINSSAKQARRLILFVQEKGQGRILAADEKPF